MAKTAKAAPSLSSAVPPSLKTSIEREIKLAVEPTFRLSPSLGRPLPTRILTSRYYDTGDHRLVQAGITLRRRTERGAGLWQLKLPVAGARRELEIAGPPGLPPSALQDLLVAHLRHEPLIEIATLRTLRKGVRVTHRDGGVADVVLDQVSVLDGRRVIHRFREIEVELVKGKARVLADLEDVLRKAGAGDHDGRPKLLRALDLPLFPKPEAPPAEAALSDHLSYSLLRQVHALLAHDPGTRWGGDPEQLHQMRVATRRLRAILRAAGPLVAPPWSEPLRDDLAWLGGLLGPVRDLDVQIESFRREANALDAHDRRPLTRFVKSLQSERQNKQADLLAGLLSERYLTFIDRMMQAARSPNIADTDLTLKDIAAKEFTKLRRSVRRLDPVPTDAALHRVRIKAKRARYAAELAESVVGKCATKFIRSVKALQDLLGKHQDAVVGEQRVRTLFAETEGQRAAFTAGRMVERQRQRRDQARAALRPLWRKVNKRGKNAWL